MVINAKRLKKGERVGGFIVQAQKHKISFSLFVMFLIGLLIGSLFYKLNNPISEEISMIFKTYKGILYENSFLSNLKNDISLNILYLIIMYIIGICAIGAPFVYLIPAIKGIGIGSISSYIYSTFKLKGFIYCLTVFYPAQIINMIFIILSCTQSYYMSKEIFYCIKGESSIRENTTFKDYNMKYCLCGIICIVSSLISSILNSFLIKAFDF